MSRLKFFVASWPRRVATLIGAALAIVLLLAARDLLRVKHDLEEGQRTLTDLDVHTIDDRGGIGGLANGAANDFDRAADVAEHSPWLGLFSSLPVVGDQVSGLRDLTRAAGQLGGLARHAADNVQRALDATHAPESRVQLLDVVHAQLVDLRRQLPLIDPGAHGWLVPPLRSARDRLVSRLATSEARLDNGIEVTATLRAFLAGPRRLLVLGGNNAEMRGAGITTTAGLAQLSGGRVDVSGFTPADQLYLQGDKTAPVPADLRNLYGWMNIGKEWRTVDTSPNFPSIAPIYASMSSQSVLGPVDGVVFVDVIALKSLVGLIGPVTVDGVNYSDSNIAAELLHRNYLTFGQSSQRGERTDLQSKVATAIFDALNQRQFSITKLAAALFDAAHGRHLMAWSRNQHEQSLWQQFKIDGALNGHQLGVLVTNVSANKLDWYIKPAVAITSERDGEGNARVHLSVTVTNPRRAPADTSPQVEGGDPGFVGPGDHRTYVLFYLPTSAYNIGNATPGFSTAGTDGPATVVGMIYIVPNGGTNTTSIDFTLPRADTKLTLLPAGRLEPTKYVVARGGLAEHKPLTSGLPGRKLDAEVDDGEPRSISLRPQESDAALELLAGLLLIAVGAALAGSAAGRLAMGIDRPATRTATVDRYFGYWFLFLGAGLIADQMRLFVR